MMTSDQWEHIKLLAKLLKTQDNAYTTHAVYLVERKVRDYGYDPDYSDTHIWVGQDGEEADPATVKRLEDEDEEDDDFDPDYWTKTAYVDRWEYVSTFLTLKAANEFRERNVHRYGTTRVYVDSGYRNYEWQFLRELPSIVLHEIERLANLLTELQPETCPGCERTHDHTPDCWVNFEECGTPDPHPVELEAKIEIPAEVYNSIMEQYKDEWVPKVQINHYYNSGVQWKGMLRLRDVEGTDTTTFTLKVPKYIEHWDFQSSTEIEYSVPRLSDKPETLHTADLGTMQELLTSLGISTLTYEGCVRNTRTKLNHRVFGPIEVDVLELPSGQVMEIEIEDQNPDRIRTAVDKVLLEYPQAKVSNISKYARFKASLASK